MLTMDPRKRATAAEIMQHPWMKENGVASDAPMDNAIVSRLDNFARANRLKKEAMKLIASAMPAEEIAGLRAIFEAIDADGSGTITAAELHEALGKQGATFTPEAAKQLMDLIDVDANGTIEYDEFLAATMSTHQMMKEENMRAAFAHFDADGDGTISREELRAALAGGAYDGPDDDIERIIDEVDKDGDGEIDYDEFVAMLSSLQAPAPCKPAKQASKLRQGVSGYKAAHSAGLVA
jgi:calcium-dependent protein kinase